MKGDDSDLRGFTFLLSRDSDIGLMSGLRPLYFHGSFTCTLIHSSSIKTVLLDPMYLPSAAVIIWKGTLRIS